MSENGKFDSVVILSTLNQMVNYVVIKKHNISKIYNITRENTKSKNFKFSNSNWDKNLKEVLDFSKDQFKPIEYDDNSIENHENIKSKLEEHFNNVDEKILWNITGGQRHFIMAITEYVFSERNETGDVIVYFDGDTGKMNYYTKDGIFRKENVNYSNGFAMSIPIALKLMGFDIGKDKEVNTSKYYNYLKSKKFHDYEEIKKTNDWYDKFYNAFCNSETLQNILITSNKSYRNGASTVLDNVINEINCQKDSIVEEIEKSGDNFEENNIFDKNNWESVFRETLANHKNGKVFGYALEWMVFYRILTKIEESEKLFDNLADIDISVKIKKTPKDNKENNEIVDEFDIFLVTKNGRVLIVECKSGGMTGDNAKSHHYSTYAVAGVYGAPVFICPIVNKEVELPKNKIKFTTKEMKNKDGNKIENDDVYEYINQALNSAKRANLEICYMKEIDKLIENYLGE